MITITDKKECCGCNSCGDICSQNAISFKTDAEGFWYPEVDSAKCINCGLCEKVCPVIHANDLKKNDFEEPDSYAAVHKNLEAVFASNSGGLFSALAEKMYKTGGYVGGAIYNDDFSVKHFISNEKKDLQKLRDSKDPQSDLSGFFIQIQGILEAGNEVLVCGCPCQMAAMRNYFVKKNDNLIIVDFICQGICSPMVWRKHIESIEKQHGKPIVHIKIKAKDYGWRSLGFKYTFSDGTTYLPEREFNLFQKGYLSGAYCRPSCYDCQFKGFPRIADITIADFWGIEKVEAAKSLDRDLGTSLVMVNSEKGRIYFDSIKPKINFISVPFNTLPYNKPLMTSLNLPKLDRGTFFRDLAADDFVTVMNKYFLVKVSKKDKLKDFLRHCFSFYRVTQFRIRPLVQFIRYNFLHAGIKSNVFTGGYLLPAPYTVIDIGKKSKVQLNSKLTLGVKRIRGSKLETRLLVDNGGTLIVNGPYIISYGGNIEVHSGGTLIINGRKRRAAFANINATIICGNRIELGESVAIGRNVTIRDTNGNHYTSQRGYKVSRPVKIGNHVWLGEQCTIMPGVTIGDDVIVAAHSVVVTDVPSGTLVYGNPAKVIQTGISWKG